MLSAVQNIIGFGKAREAQNADTRLDMPPHSGEYNQKHDRKNIEKNRKFYDHDESTISVESALLFLEGFLEARLDKALKEHRGVHTDMMPWIETKVSNQNTGLAVRAYQHAAEISKNLRKGGDLSLEAQRREELKVIYQLIQDLRSLAEKGVEQLRIDSDASFLEAIADSVAWAKAQ